MSRGGGLPNSKTPTLCRKKFSMMVSLFRSIMPFTIVAWPGWFMNASISMDDLGSSRFCGGGSDNVMDTMGYNCTRDVLLL